MRINAEREQSETTGEECTQPALACTLPVAGLVPGWNPESVVAPYRKSRFWAASGDGGRAVFSVFGGTAKEALYEYDLTTRTVARIAGESLGVAGSSTDLSHLYFASKEALAGAGANAAGQTPQAGKPNLYLLVGGAGGSLSFVATLSEADLAVGAGENSPPSPLAPTPLDHVARAHPRRLAPGLRLDRLAWRL